MTLDSKLAEAERLMTPMPWTPYALRLPEPLKQKLTEDAVANHRSLNAEIVHRLWESAAANVYSR